MRRTGPLQEGLPATSPYVAVGQIAKHRTGAVEHVGRYGAQSSGSLSWIRVPQYGPPRVLPGSL
jgi:hypothetical protein